MNEIRKKIRDGKTYKNLKKKVKYHNSLLELESKLESESNNNCDL